MNRLLVDPFAGASGDMFLGALIDLGVDADQLRGQLLKVPALADMNFSVESVRRGAFAATKVTADFPHEHVHRGLSDVVAIIDQSDIADTVKEGARQTFTRLAMAEAKVHGTSVEKVHFHEVGARDAIMDIVGFHLACDLLGVRGGYYTSIRLGTGTTTSAHGTIPVPVPATVELLNGHRTEFTGREMELVTPTGAAILAAGFEPLPRGASLVLGPVGYGAGTRDPADVANVLRVVKLGADVSARRIAVLECTVDDASGEALGHAMEALLGQGALDVFFAPAHMKKNRPGTLITVVSETASVPELTEMLFRETTTLGVRWREESRWELERRQEQVETSWGTADVKVATLPDGTERVSPEFDSCARLAEAAGVPLMDVYRQVVSLWNSAD